MTVYLAGTQTRPYVVENFYRNALKLTRGAEMTVFLAGKFPFNEEMWSDKVKALGVSILESFYYITPWQERMIPYFKSFSLDSGAFTLFTDKSKGTGIRWEEYVDRYAEFVRKNNVSLFFELDIDALVGYQKVLELRDRLERKAGRQCIPVWHRSRGKAEFLKSCESHKYVAIGGIVSKEIRPDNYKFFPWFINEAHKRGVKIHGLGFTSLASLPRYHFDSVDSTSWTTGNRFGMLYHFDGKRMTVVDKREGQRFKDSRLLAINNWNEWVKYQRYAEVKL